MGKKLERGVNDLETVFPEIAREWNYEKNKGLKTKSGKDISTPDNVTASSSQKVWWICPVCGHEWYAKVQSRTKNHGMKCPECSKRDSYLGKDIKTVNPHLLEEWDYELNAGLKPETIAYNNSVIMINWYITAPHPITGEPTILRWQDTAYNRNRGYGCPVLSGKVVLKGFNDLATIFPELATEWDYEGNSGRKDGRGKDVSTPDKISWGSNLSVSWRCPVCNYVWEATISHRREGYCSCPSCSGVKLIQGQTDLQTVRPDVAKSWHPTKNGDLKPTDVTSGSKKRIWWLCPTCGHAWESTVNNRTSSNSGCPCCAGLVIVAGVNDLATTHPELAKQWDYQYNRDLFPTNVGYGQKLKVWWRCPEGHRWKTVIYDRVDGCGCPICAESHGEKTIRKILQDNQIQFKEQYKFKDRFGLSGKQLLRDDFAILDTQGNVVGTIEYHGKQHYKPVDFAGKGLLWAEESLRLTQERDKIKSDYLAKRGIPQLIIPYWDFDNIEKLVSEFITELSKTHKLWKTE